MPLLCGGSPGEPDSLQMLVTRGRPRPPAPSQDYIDRHKVARILHRKAKYGRSVPAVGTGPLRIVCACSPACSDEGTCLVE